MELSFNQRSFPSYNVLPKIGGDIEKENREIPQQVENNKVPANVFRADLDHLLKVQQS